MSDCPENLYPGKTPRSASIGVVQKCWLRFLAVQKCWLRFSKISKLDFGNDSSQSQIKWSPKRWFMVTIFFLSPDASMWLVGSKRLQTPFSPDEIEVVKKKTNQFRHLITEIPTSKVPPQWFFGQSNLQSLHVGFPYWKIKFPFMVHKGKFDFSVRSTAKIFWKTSMMDLWSRIFSSPGIGLT